MKYAIKIQIIFQKFNKNYILKQRKLAHFKKKLKSHKQNNNTNATKIKQIKEKT